MNIQLKYQQIKTTNDRLLRYCDELDEMLKKVFKGVAIFGVTQVGGEGIQMVYELDGGFALNVHLTCIIQTIKNKGYFDDDDLEENSYG